MQLTKRQKTPQIPIKPQFEKFKVMQEPKRPLSLGVSKGFSKPQKQLLKLGSQSHQESVRICTTGLEEAKQLSRWQDLN